MANLIRQRGDMLAEDRRDVPKARRDMIHDHRKWADSHGPKLPFEIGIFKPKLGSKPRDTEVVCECGHSIWVSRITHGVVCPSCKKFIVVK